MTADPSTLRELLLAQSRARPDRIAYHDGPRQITFGELAERGAAQAAQLAAMGVRPGDRVALVMSAGIPFTEAFWALQLLGATSCAFNPSVPAQTIERRTERIRPRLVLTDQWLDDASPAASAGAGYAAVKLPKGSVGNKQLKNRVVTAKKIKNGAVTDAKIANQAITGGKIKLGTLGPVPSANQANSANFATSATSATSASSAQPAAFAHVSSGTGALDTGNSKNVGSVTVNTGASSLCCIAGIPFTPKGGQATVDGNVGGATDGAQFTLGTTSGCPAGTQAMVYTYNAFGDAPDGFFVMFYE